ncbi:TPA: glycosyltransferase family 4 protein [Escherichia coli]|nr:glycosyltransferase family 4 protein [Escherichia coli]MXG06982.1 glycosyltransferase [Escherichia coli]
MKICYVITKADEIGGAQIHVRDLSIQLAKDNNEVFVIVGENGALVDELVNNNISVYVLPTLVRQINPIKDFQSILKLRKIIKKNKPDLISLHSSKAGIVGRLAAIGTDIPVIFTAHGWAFANGVGKRQQKLYCAIEKIMSPFAKKIITVSQQDKDLAIKYRVVSAEKQVVIHNGMPEIEMVCDNKKIESYPTIKLISVARFSEQKDHKTLFLALKELKDYDWSLSLVGKGPLIDHYKKYAIELGIFERIKFLGERSDVADLLSESNVFLLISNWEGFPRSILEAMRAGLPVIASDVGGTSESVLNNKTGFLISRNDVHTLKEKIEILIKNEALRNEMGRYAREIYLANFTFDSMYNKTVALYKSLINIS